jgi:chromate transporter
MAAAPTFKEALKFWFKLGFISFGGPAGQIAIMHEFLVDKKKWISNSRFLHALNYCMLLPGPEAQQLATYSGWLLHGTWGGLAAGILFVLPSMLILLGLSIIYVTYGNLSWIQAAFTGLKPAVVAIVILAVVKIGKKALSLPIHYFIAAFAFILIYFANIPFPLIILWALVTAFLVKKFSPQWLEEKTNGKQTKSEDESVYFINKNTVIEGSGFSLKRLAKQVSAAILLWSIPFVLFYLLTSDYPFWKQLSLFFTQAAIVTFGGAYSVLPYVAQVSVEKLNWLTELQMLDGLALGETTPGPLVIVLAFVGFMAGFNHFESSLIMGTIGLLTTTFYTFIPSFLFILCGAPIIERTQDNIKIKNILTLVTAAIVGVVLNLAIYLGNAVVFGGHISWESTNWLALSWIIVSIIAMYKFEIGMIKWIGISAIFGIITSFIN